MSTNNKNRHFFTAALFVLALSNAPVSAIPAYTIDFVKGDITKKTQAVINAAEQGDTTIAVKAIDFAINEHSTIGDDADLTTLLATAIQSVGTNPQNGQLPGLTEKLITIFQTFNADDIKIMALDRLTLFPSPDAVTLINTYISECAQNAVPMNQVLLKAISSLGMIGNNSSCCLLLAVALDGIWPSYNKQIEYAFGPLANNDENDILRIMNAASLGEKFKILQLIERNEKISANIKGEVAESALTASISSTGENAGVTQDRIQLQLQSMHVLAEAKWTRAATLVSNAFQALKAEYESSLITGEQFAQVITDTAAIGSSDIGMVLSSYLDSLNKSMEKGQVPSKTVVLASINSLGSLGDKTAFDCLLYVTYLEYPEEVTSAARNALAKLKW